MMLRQELTGFPDSAAMVDGRLLVHAQSFPAPRASQRVVASIGNAIMGNVDTIKMRCSGAQGRRTCDAEGDFRGGVVFGNPRLIGADSATVEITLRIFTGRPSSIVRIDEVSLVRRGSAWEIVGFKTKEVS